MLLRRATRPLVRALIVVGAVLLASAVAVARGTLGEGRCAAPARAAAPARDSPQPDLDLIRARLDRAEAIIAYASSYRITADLSSAIYDIALSEGIDPALAFRLIRVESNFMPYATSGVGAIGYTQVLPSTARLYDPELTVAQLYETDTNLRLGFRYLRDLLERFEGDPESALRLALLAYNRGPARVQELLEAGHDPENGYAAAIMKGYGTWGLTP